MTGFLSEMNFALYKKLDVVAKERGKKPNKHLNQQQTEKNRSHKMFLIKVHAIKEMTLQLYKAEDTSYV